MPLWRKLASQSTVIFGARLFGAGLIFLVQAAIARTWGADALGEYIIVIATVNLVAVVMPLGFHTVGTYFAAEYRARGDRQQLVRFLARSYGHLCATAVLLLVFGQPLIRLFGPSGATLQTHFLPVVLLATATATVFVNGAVLVGLRRPIAGFFADTLLRPTIVIGAFAASLSIVTDAFGRMLWILAIGYAAVALVQLGVVLASTARLEDGVEPRPLESRRWWRFALPWVLISFATDFFFDIDLLLLSHLLSREDLAIFGVCARVFSLVSFGVGAVYAVTMPDMFESEAKADRAGFQRKLAESNLVATCIAVLLFVLTLIFGPMALTLFGPAFAAGAAPLAVLCLGLVVRAVMGPASLVLSMHDRPWASLPAVLLGVASLVAFNVFLVPVFGLMGAGWAALLSIALWSSALWLTAYRQARVDVSLFARWRRTPQAVAAE